ncbi:MAG: hypothetical protein KF760_21840 [Candidatus Eremiobacteraeota bacterium]|nr:hypothetical protein [Candidatus Eremiobacteraeota bacterium]
MAINNNWGTEAVKIFQSADRIHRSDWTARGDALGGQTLIDSYIPTDRDYSREERAQQQKQLREMMMSVHQERRGREAR